jgi:hypothetical protein
MTSSTDARRSRALARRAPRTARALRQRALGAHDALRDRGLGHQEGARDLVRRETAHEAQRQRDPRLLGQHGVARREHEAQEVVCDVVAQVRVDARLRLLELLRDLARELVLLPGVQLALAQAVEGAVLGGGHEPRGRIVGHARLRPRLECCDQRVLRELLGDADVAHHARDAGDDLRRLHAKDRFDRLVRRLGGHAARASVRRLAARCFDGARGALRIATAQKPPASEDGTLRGCL